uniref:Protein kinase domain-containing protein n=1 Tax=Chromera velia CCMP2878 TaxID=1169474 RepID=A0A0G4I217_9ALVE|eukprot:Cvel_10281.t1-p1 / transcript=Cvel_10281.t1 / gene=Cvel_10281 / organism=Chromera_velia_CCMP2878 / gene_product=hypothetical protein / transcript_product=hypothetical protein / location=Cvel_scaffold617:14013-16630(-) / protein_length=213 / sequence_SO=supercontig / SO=protein_coding / is_pseudo=false
MRAPLLRDTNCKDSCDQHVTVRLVCPCEDEVGGTSFVVEEGFQGRNNVGKGSCGTNLLIDEKAELLKVCDFGLARLVGTALALPSSPSPTVATTTAPEVPNSSNAGDAAPHPIRIRRLLRRKHKNILAIEDAYCSAKALARQEEEKRKEEQQAVRATAAAAAAKAKSLYTEHDYAGPKVAEGEPEIVWNRRNRVSPFLAASICEGRLSLFCRL